MNHIESQKEMPAILVVDDDSGICQLISEAINMQGYKAATAFSVQEGLAKYKEVEVSGVLLDISMVNQSGIDFLDKLNKSGFHAPVALISGLVTCESLIMAVKLGAIDFLAKPFELSELTTLIHKLVAIGSRQRRVRDLLGIIEAMVEPSLIQEIKDLERQIGLLRTFEPEKFKAKKAI
jgi:DNA-binding NtrC family response regulator